MIVRKLALALIVVTLLPVLPGQAGELRHLFLCRSPLTAYDFWNTLYDLDRKGVTMTQTIVEQICRGMKAGNDPRCIRVDAENFRPVASGWAGAMTMTDGVTKVWFHNPDAGGWVHPDYCIYYLNAKPQ